MNCTQPELTYCHHRHNGRCLADKIERCDMDNSLLTEDERENLKHALRHLEANPIYQKDSAGGWFSGNKVNFIKRHVRAIEMLNQWLNN